MPELWGGIFVLGNVLYYKVGSVYCTVISFGRPLVFSGKGGGPAYRGSDCGNQTKAIATTSRDWNLHKSQVP